MGMMRPGNIRILMGWLAVVVLLATATASQATGDIFVWQFQHSLAGIQEARASAVDSQGNLIITGYTNESGNDDFYTLKLSSDGQTVLWEARHIHPQGDDWAVAVAVDGNDDVIVTGHLFNGVNYDIAVVKYDSLTGNPEWQTPFILNGVANGHDMPMGLALDSLNNIYVVGYSQNGGTTGDDGLLFKLSPAGPTLDGTPVWQVPFNGTASGEDHFEGVSAGTDGIAVVGYTTVMHDGGRQDFDYLTIKLDYSGNTLWQKTYDHGVENDQAAYVGIDSAGNVLVSGKAMAAGRQDMVTIKYGAADGQQLWHTPYSVGSPNVPRGLVVDSDDEVYITASSFTPTGKDDFYTVRYAGASGAPVWEKLFDSGPDNSDVPKALALDRTGGLYVAGSTHKETTGDDDFQTLKYNKENGNLIWQQAQDGPPVGGNQQPVGVAVALGLAADGHVYVAGWSQQAENDLDYFAVKYNADLLNAPTGLTASVVSQTRVDLAWEDNSNAPNNEDSFCVERCQGFQCTDFITLTCGVAQDQTTYSDTTVSRDTWYSYRVLGSSTALAFSLPTAPAAALTTVINYPAPEWLYSHDTDGLDDQAFAIAVDSENNPVATGMSATANSQYDYYTVKLDRTNAATPFWVDTYDSPDGQGDMGICLAVDSNDDVVVSGFSSIDAGGGINTNDLFTIKYAATGPDPYSGYPLWTAQYNGPGNDDDRSTAVASAADGSNFMVVTGYGKNAAANDDIYLIKYKPDYDPGNQEVWSITPYDGGFNDYPMTTLFTPDGDVVLVGKTYNASGNSDLLISKYSGTDGTLLGGWPYIHDSGHGADGINALAVATDGSIYVAGYAMNANGKLDIYVNKFNGNGAPQWGGGKIIEGPGQGYDEAVAIAIDPNDGEIVVGATITSSSGSMDFQVLRYRPDGTLRWQKTLDQIEHDEMLTGMALSPSGEICLAGETEKGTDTDILAVKYDHAGNLIGSTKVDNGFDDHASAIAVNRLGEFYIAGYSATGELASDDYDFLVFRFNGQALQAPSPFTAITHNTTVDLAWSENDPAVTGYKLYRKNGACSVGGTTFNQSNLIHTAATGTVEFTDSGLNIGSTYCYGVQAYRTASGEVSRVSERQVTTTTPVPPNNVVATIKNTSEVEVCWHDNSGSEDGFAIQRCSGDNCTFSQYLTLFAPPELDETAETTCFVDTSACNSGTGKTFRYRVQAYKVNAWNSGFNGASDTVIVPDLLAPSALTATRVAEAKVEMQWLDNTVDETEFVIERCQGANCTNFSEIGTVSAVQGNELLLEMDEPAWTGAEGEIDDSSGKGRLSTAYNGPTTVAESHQGRAGSLDGSNDFLIAPLHFDQTLQPAGVTMMAWVKPASTSNGEHYLFSTESGSPGQLKNSWGLLRNGNTWQIATGEAVRPTGMTVTTEWQHLAVVFDPSTGVRFYQDGSEVYIPNIGVHASSAYFFVGRQGMLNQNFFDGLVDEVAVYSRALTAAEVQKIRARGIFPEASGRKWFTDTTVSYNQEYRYQIKARKLTECGTDYSLPSPALALTTAPPPPQPVTALEVEPGVVSLSWTPQTSTQTGFQVERCNGAGCTAFAIVTSALGATVSNFTDRTACFGSDGVNRYQVKALGPWGESAPSAVAEVGSVVTPPPANLTVTQATEASVKLSWNYNPNRDRFTLKRCAGDQATCDQSPENFSEVAGSPVSGQDPTLLAFWRLDDLAWSGVSGEVTDSSGHGHHGTTNNGVTLASPGATLVSGYGGSGAASLDGVDDFINTELTVDQSPTSPGATFMAWIYPTDNSNSRWQHLFSTDNGGYDWGLKLISGTWYIENGGGNYVYTGVQAAMNTWQQIAVVFDPASGVKLYHNGVLVSSSAIIGFSSSNLPLFIGRLAYSSYYNYNYKGKVDEVRVFQRPLSATEVAGYYNQGGSPFTFTDSSGITTGTTYTYRLSPLGGSSCGDWAGILPVAEVSATTPAVPNAPTNLVVAQNGSTELALSWQANTSSESGFVIERCQGTGCDFSTVDSFQVGAGVTSYLDSSVCEGLTYRYRVKAVNGSAAPWLWETSSTPPVEKGTVAAAPVPTVTLSAISESEVDISWSDANQDEDDYVLSRCQVESGVRECDQAAQFTELDTFPGSIAGALLHYRMDEAAWNGTPDEVQDASGNARHGRSYGAISVGEGRFGRAGSFNGSSSYLATPLVIDQGRNSAGVTMEAWVFPTLIDTAAHHVLSTDNGGNDWGVVVQNGRWHVNTGSSLKDTGLTADLNTWQHITVVFTPLSGIRFYKDGTLFATTEIDYDLSANALTIGRNPYYSYGSEYFQGTIDEVMVYGRPLTEAEVLVHNTTPESPAYSYRDTGAQHSSTFWYKVTARKAAGCGWAKETLASIVTPPPPPPTDLMVDSADSTKFTLEWLDNNGSESRYVVSRCEGTPWSCSDLNPAVVVNLPANPGIGAMSYNDEGLCPGRTYTYRVWAEGAWGTTAYAETNGTTAALPTPPTSLSAHQASEVALDLAWTYQGADETGLKLERCQGTACAELDLPAGTTSYADSELAPNTEYCYRVKAYKTATCGWETAWDGPVCATTALTAGALQASATDTTTVNLNWGDNTRTETTSTVERCSGDLVACCNGGNESCSGPFEPVGVVSTNQHDYDDPGACAGNTYTYRVNIKGEGLSRANNGCWTKRAPLTFASFPAFRGVEVVIPYQAEMRADFADLRFYDATGHRELQYWLREKTDSVSATVWLMTGANAEIFLYYGNPQATDGSATDAVFTEVYDEFGGNAIDPQKWVVIDPPTDKISQDNGLKFIARDTEYSTPPTYRPVLNAAVFSTRTFERAAGNELLLDLTVGSDATYPHESFYLGWEQDQTASADWIGNGAHLLNLACTNHTTFFLQYVYEDTSQTVFPLVRYNDLTRYQVKIVLNAQGAKYYLKGGTLPAWSLLKETTTARPGDDLLRIGFHQAYHNITIHQVTVKHASAQHGVSVNFAGAEGDGSTCIPFSHTWTSSPTSAAEVVLGPPLAPSGLTASVVAGKVELAWSAGTGDESEFRVERNCGGSFAQIGTTLGGVTNYADGSMPVSTACTYRVIGHKEAPCPWTTAPSAEVGVLAPPAGPLVTVTPENPFQLRLDWSDAADEEGYEVEAQVFNGAWVPIATLPADRLSYTDNHGVNPSTQYTYRVRARRATGNSAWGQASAATPAYTSGAGTCPLP